MKKFNNRSVLLLLGLFFLLPMLSAFFIRETKLYQHFKITAVGELIQPAQKLQPQILKTFDKQLATPEILKKKWQLIFWEPKQCEDACLSMKQQLQNLRGVLGHDRSRVILLTIDEQPQVHEANVYQQQALAQAGSVFIVDPLGNFMMQYPPKIAVQGILKDVQKLLKYSKIG